MSNTHSNRCFTYPQGELVIVPQILALVAVACSLFVLYADSFMCYIFRETVSSIYQTYECFPLSLTSEEYWIHGTDSYGWAGAIKAGAFFAILALVLGIFALSMLMSGTCFALKPVHLLTASILLTVSAVFSILVLVAGAADICKKQDNPASCVKDESRLSTGGAAVVFALIFYVIAAAVTFVGFFVVRRRYKQEQDQQQQSTTVKSVSQPPQQIYQVTTHQQDPSVAVSNDEESFAVPPPVQVQVQQKVQQPIPPSSSPTVTIQTLPNGDKKIEKTFVEADGSIRREITIEKRAGMADV